MDDQAPPRQPFAETIVGVTLEGERHALRDERSEALSRRTGEPDTNGVLGQAAAAIPLRHLVAEHRAHRAIGVADERLQIDRAAMLERRQRRFDQIVVERDVELVILFAHTTARHRRGEVRLVQ
jgi:hypothetical protein